ncbi:TPA: hypothetical protein ACSW15_004998 [Enterobacter hormaechei]|uniref:hypothetical protein n=1 Tax=Enterobacter hormaechei TaxID=158836 RepID=UPI00079615B1|nr:hypothetical protein [Enterobacter hormaechei]CZW99367.1 Uncharacterised protein [Enterobacter hormaechei]
MTLTKEWLLKTIAELEEERVAVPGVVNEDAAKALAAMKLALASLEAKPVAQVLSSRAGNDTSTIDKALPEGTMLYNAMPAPASVPAALENDIDSEDHPLLWSYNNGWNACRAAMLQGADGTLTDEGTKRVDELVMWIKRLAHSLRKSNPDSKLQSDAMDYLSRKGLIGVEDILR